MAISGDWKRHTGLHPRDRTERARGQTVSRLGVADRDQAQPALPNSPQPAHRRRSVRRKYIARRHLALRVRACEAREQRDRCEDRSHAKAIYPCSMKNTTITVVMTRTVNTVAMISGFISNKPKLIGRSERIRTSGPCVPNTVLYQAELHSDRAAAYKGRPVRRQGA